MISVGAFALPGVSISYDIFIPILYRAVHRGFVSQIQAHFVHQGLRWGFDLGFSPDKLPGRRFFKNYRSALDAEQAVSKNIFGRLENKKSYPLFPFDPATFRGDLSSFLSSWCVFPLGAVPKPNEPGSYRPISDHSRTGFNDASTDEHLRYSLRSASEIARYLGDAFHMAVHDVDAAFPLLPLSPVLWPYFLFVWRPPPGEPTCSEGGGWWLHWNVCGDFGAKGLPGTFKIFFTDVLVGMARSEGALSTPMPVHVDDMAIIGRLRGFVDAQASSLAKFLADMGAGVKESKHRVASQVQFVIGFWWDSVLRTRCLEEKKVSEYVAMFLELAERRSLSLTELRQAAGRLQRAVLTLPPGAACLLANLFSLMRGLTRPQARRRLSREGRRDLRDASGLLSQNMGRGFFSHAHFGRAPRVATDASRSPRYTGGGYLSMCGRFSWWRYGSSASRHPIDTLEGDTVLKAARDLGRFWRGKVVPFSIDNQAFQRSAVKGWSRAHRITVLVRSLFSVAISSGCIFEFAWISTHDNIYADALSRPDPLSSFLALVMSPSSQLRRGTVLRRASDSGGVKPLEPPLSPYALSLSSPPPLGGGEPRGGSQGGAPSSGPPSGGDARAPQVPFSLKNCPWPDTMRATTCPACKGAAEWSCTERRSRRCDAVRCPKGCTDPTCWCSIDDIGCEVPTKNPGAVTFVNFGKAFSSDVTGDGPSGRSARVPVAFSVSYPRASIFTGLPTEGVRSSVESIMADRLSASSHASIGAALSHWSVVARRHGWPRVIVADDPLRGGKLSTFVSFLVDETQVKSTSIQNYVWALRAWFKLQRQPDPVYGVLEWDDFMQSVDVVAWVQREPRKALPLPVLRRSLEAVDLGDFVQVQTALLLLVLFFTFARSETPCPKSFSGRGSFDPTKHLQVWDVEVRRVGGRPCVAVRLKSIKQDPRMERPEAAGGEDWILIGNVEGVFSILAWISRFWIFFSCGRGLPGARSREPLFQGCGWCASPHLRQCPQEYAESSGGGCPGGGGCLIWPPRLAR